MTDIVDRLLDTTDRDRIDDAIHEITALRAEIERLRKAYSLTQDAVQQTLGRALGYPWFKDDQHNFPGATEADGVCVGDHVAESIADETAAKIAALRAALRRIAGSQPRPLRNGTYPAHDVDNMQRTARVALEGSDG